MISRTLLPGAGVVRSSEGCAEMSCRTSNRTSQCVEYAAEPYCLCRGGFSAEACGITEQAREKQSECSHQIWSCWRGGGGAVGGGGGGAAGGEGGVAVTTASWAGLNQPSLVSANSNLPSIFFPHKC